MNESCDPLSQEIDLSVKYSLSPQQPLFNQVKILVQEMTNKKLMRSSKHELSQIISVLGWEGEKFLFLTLLENLDLKEGKDKGPLSFRATYFSQTLQ